MKLDIGSDLHLEFGRGNLQVPGGADALILAGDICTPYFLKPEFAKFFGECASKYPKIFYVLGNHEHYGGNIEKTVLKLRKWFQEEGWPIRILDDEVAALGDNLQIYGSTFWTDMKNSDPVVMWDVQRGMNDYRQIDRRNNTKLRPETTIYKNKVSLRKLKEVLKSNINTLVVTHHAPSYQSIPSIFKADILSFAYANNLDQFIIENPSIIAWVHGHTHSPFLYEIEDCPVICNPRGYLGIENTKDYKFFTMEIKDDGLA